MKAVLVGADLMYRQDGKLVPIEINTNVGWDDINRVEQELDEIFDLEEFKAFLDEHNLTEVWVDGLMSHILVPYFAEKGLVTKQASEEELREDRDGILLLRGAYSDEALVDAFCRDKITFLEAIRDKDYGSEFLYKTEEGFSGRITTFLDNGNYPNFIVKCRYPAYDRAVYPKLVKLANEEELNQFIQSEEFEVDYLIMPFYYNENNLWENGEDRRMKIIRQLSIYVAENGLREISLGRYTKLCGNLKGIEPGYSELGVMDSKSRDSFLDHITRSDSRGLLAEEGDLILMADDSWKPVQELKRGDKVKSLNLPHQDVDIWEHTGDYNVSFDEMQADSTFEITTVDFIKKVEKKIYTRTKLKFIDGTDWWDTPDSSYPILDEDGSIRFELLANVRVGNKVMMLNASNFELPRFELREIAEISSDTVHVQNGYILSTRESHLFLSKTSEDSVAYIAIEHNSASHIMCHWSPNYVTDECMTYTKSGYCGGVQYRTVTITNHTDFRISMSLELDDQTAYNIASSNEGVEYDWPGKYLQANESIQGKYVACNGVPPAVGDSGWENAVDPYRDYSWYLFLDWDNDSPTKVVITWSNGSTTQTTQEDLIEASSEVFFRCSDCPLGYGWYPTALDFYPDTD